MERTKRVIIIIRKGNDIGLRSMIRLRFALMWEDNDFSSSWAESLLCTGDRNIQFGTI